jgi:hypothetical protein
MYSSKIADVTCEPRELNAAELKMVAGGAITTGTGSGGGKVSPPPPLPPIVTIRFVGPPETTP